MKQINLKAAYILQNARKSTKGATLETTEKQLKTVANSAMRLLKHLKELNAPAMDALPLDVNVQTLAIYLKALQKPDKSKLSESIERHKSSIVIPSGKGGETPKLRDDIYEMIAISYMLETKKEPDYKKEFKEYFEKAKESIEWQVRHAEGGKKGRSLSYKSALGYIRNPKNLKKIIEKVENKQPKTKKKASQRIR